MPLDRFGDETEDPRDGTTREKRSHTSSRAPRPPRWETVPSGTRPVICRGKSCGKEIFFIERPRAGGKPGTVRIPIDCDVDGGARPDSWTEGRGLIHFATCPDADRF